jgi:hypothetical protein
MAKFRQPDWRHEQAQHMAQEAIRQDKPPKPPKGTDPMVAAQAVYLWDWHRNEQGRSAVDPAVAHPLLHEANRLMSETSRMSIRYVLEAYALSDLTDAQVATEADEEDALVKAFYDIYFDLRDPGAKRAYVKGMYAWTKAYERRLYCHMGYKYIMAYGGLDRFRRIIMDRSKMTDGDRAWLESDKTNLRQMYDWSRTWEAMNDGVRPDPLLMQQDAMMAGQAKGTAAEEGDRPVFGVMSEAAVIKIGMLDAEDKKAPAVEKRAK